MREPLRILILAANPVDTSEMALKAEHRLLRNKMRANEEAGNCEMLFEWAARFKDLKDALAGHKPHVIHFAGHGSQEGIFLEDNEGRSSPLTKAQLADLIKSSGEHVRLVVLNACFSALQAEAMRESVDFVVGTKVAVPDDLAVVFVAHFYEALAVGNSVRDAYQKTQNKLASLDQRALTEQYELLVRSGTDEDQPLLPPMLPPTRENISENTFGRIRTPTAEFVNVSDEGRHDDSSHLRGPNEKNVQRNHVADLKATTSVSFINKRNRR
ncbi:MAG: CHAT domain-containing protein [Pyrinomonadaceae bacterium]